MQPQENQKKEYSSFYFYGIYLAFVLGTLFVSCQSDSNKTTNTYADKPAIQVHSPGFNADSAYQFIQRQVDFGPRVPNTASHVACGDWLESRLKDYTHKVYIQKGQVEAYNGEKLNFRNIIGSFNPENPKRIMLCAHWDTRPYADQDPDPSKWEKPIDGANDGASGVGVLLEIARLLNQQPVDLGVDIILFDAEDYGQPEFKRSGYVPDSYCLGSQYWARNPHKPGYSAKYGILLDMVGAKGSQFLMEGYSNKYAPSVVRNVWNTAAELGYSSYFPFKKSDQPVIDDHYYINIIAGIPTIDIIHLENNRPSMFADFWHTHEDNMEIIDKQTLKAVGQTVLHVVYKEDKGAL